MVVRMMMQHKPKPLQICPGWLPSGLDQRLIEVSYRALSVLVSLKDPDAMATPGRWTLKEI